MLKENWRTVSRVQRLGDTLIIILAFFAAYYGRTSFYLWDLYFGLRLPFEGPELAPISTYLVVLIVALVGYTVALNSLGAYDSMRMSSPWRLLRISAFASIIVFVLLGAFLFLLKLDLSRSLIGLFCVVVALSLSVERYIVLRLLRYWRRRGKNFRNIIVAGVGEQASRLALLINSQPELGIFIRGFVALKPEVAKELEFKRALAERGYRYQIRVLLGAKALERALREYAVDEVIFTDIVPVMPIVEELVLLCSEQGVRTTIAADLFAFGLVRSGISYFSGMPLIHFQTPPGDRWELTVKRWLDIFVSAFLLLILSPLMLLLALLVKLTSPGRIFFVQNRVGLNGRLFQLYKFRSMVIDAERGLEALRDKNQMRGPVFKIAQDPRVTRFGQFLRRYSLDELPQLWNVLRGDMSLVGPRPPIPGEVSMYERRDRRRLSMRPGLTCIWQVEGRNAIKDFDQWVKLDLAYIDNWSLMQDFVLLAKTVPAIVFGTGK